MAYFQPRAPDGGANGGIFWSKERRHFGSFGEMCQRWRVRPELVAMRLGMGMELGRALTTPPRKA